MKNLFIPYGLAVIAKEKGFDEPCFGYYNIVFKEEALGYCYPNKNNWHSNSVDKAFPSAPLYQQIVDWFREKKILIEVFPVDDWNNWVFRISAEDLMSPFFIAVQSQSEQEFKTYYEALNKAITEAFKLI